LLQHFSFLYKLCDKFAVLALEISGN